MTSLTTMTVADVLDAVAYAKAYAARDLDGQQVLAEHGDPGAMLAALTSLYVGLLGGRGDGAVGWLDGLADQIAARGIPGAAS